MPKTIAPTKMNAAQTATRFSGLMKVIGVASLCFTRRIIASECRFQNMKSVMRCKSFKSMLQFD